MDYYKCENCGKVFDEFEMNYREAQIDKRTLCDSCRKLESKYENEKTRQEKIKMKEEKIWSKDGTAYLKGDSIYSWKEATKRGFVSKEEADSHDDENEN